MATSFNFLEAEKELQQPKKPSFDFLEAEKALQPRQATTQPVQARQPVQPLTPAIEPPKAPTTPSMARPSGIETTEVGGVDITGFGSTLDMISTEVTKPKPTVADVVRDEQKFDVVQRFMKERYPNKKLPEDPTALVEEFRSSQVKGDIGLGRELSWALNATPAQKEVARQAYEISDDLGSTLGRELAVALNPFESPSTYVTLGAGWAAKQALLRPVAVSAVKKALITTGVTTGVEATAAGATNVLQQTVRKELDLQKEIDYAQLALATGIGAAFGAAEGVGISKVKAEQAPQRIAALVERKKKGPTPEDKQTNLFLKQFAEREKEVDLALFESSVERQAARETSLDKMQPPKEVTEAVLNENIIKDIFNVAKQIYVDYPLLRPDLKEKRITQAVIDTLDAADEDMIQQAASRAGVNSQEFFDAFKVTLSQAGATLKEASTLSRFLNKQAKGDPKLEEALQRMSRANYNIEYLTGEAIRKVGVGIQASVPASTASLSTTVLNVIGLTGAIPLKVFADAVDAVYTKVGRMIYDQRGGASITTARKIEVAEEIFDDSFYLLNGIINGGYISELNKLMLTSQQPRLRSLITDVGSESDLRGVPQLMKAINFANIAVDKVVRGPIFNQAVKERMDAIGLDYEEYIANNKNIPLPVLKDAIDDALKLTFSYGFKDTGEVSLEGFAETAAFKFLNLLNANAGTSALSAVAYPFMRFSLNAIRHTYRMTPASALGGYQELRQAKKFLNEGKTAEAAGLVYEGKKKIIDGVVGSAAIAGFISFRLDNSDLAFNEYRDSEGNIRDGSGLFPFVNMAAIAEFALLLKDLAQNLWYTLTMTPEERAEEAKKLRAQAESLALNDSGRQRLIMKAEQLGLNRVRKFDGQKFIEVITGQGRASMTQNSFVDRVTQLAEGGWTANMEKKAGTAVGDFFGRYDNVLNPVYELANFLREDFRVVDTRASTALELDPFSDAVIGPLAGPVPFARDILEERSSLFQSTPQQAPTVLRQVQGQRPTPPTSQIENELARLRIPSFSVLKSSGDRSLDNLTMRLAQPYFQQRVEDLIFDDPVYKRLSTNGQRRAIELRMQEALNEVKPKAREIYLQSKPVKEINRMYDALSRAQREADEDTFMQAFGRRPTTPEDKMRVIQGDFGLAEAVGKSSGTTPDQMRSLGLGR
jgi:hypothetical protein